MRNRSAQAVACQHGSLGALSILDGGPLLEVLRRAKTTKVLAPLASTSRQLCTLARSGVPLTLCVTSPEHAQLVLRSYARGRPPFHGCTRLELEPYNTADCLVAAGVLGVAQHWSTLQQLRLMVNVDPEELPDGYTVDICVSALLGTLPALQQLRCLELILPDTGPCSGECIGHLVQLTSLWLRGSRENEAADTQLDMRSWSRLVNLRQMYMDSVLGAQPAAGAAGPFCLPSSLTAVTWWYDQDPEDLACLVTHLPGCPQLQELDIRYGPVEEVCAHPAAVVQLLGQHNRQLRKLAFEHESNRPAFMGGAMPALPAYAGGHEDGEWRPDAALSALTGLQELNANCLLTLRAAADWQHLAQLTALTRLCGAVFHCAPQLQAGAALCVLDLEGCRFHVGGRGLGLILAACPQLQDVQVDLAAPLAAALEGPSQAQLQPHPRLKALVIRQCHHWGSILSAAAMAPPPAPAAAAAGPAPEPVTPAAAAAQFAGLAPVLAGVSELALIGWPAGISGSSSSSNSSSRTTGILPDLSPCTALTKLVFDSYIYGRQDLPPLEQEEYLSMVAPLTQLRCLQLERAARVNARIVLVLQLTLPHLQRVELYACGRQLPLLPEGSEQQQKQAALDRVKQLLRPGLVLYVGG